MTALTTSLKHFATLNRAPGPTWTDSSKRKAPHKPLLLLAVLDLVHRGVIQINEEGEFKQWNSFKKNFDGMREQFRILC